MALGSWEGGGRTDMESVAMAILITGAGGFVGSKVMESWPEALAWPHVDLTERAAVEQAVRALPPLRGVLHLAALSSVRRSFEEPLEVYRVNLMGTLHLLEALSAAGQRPPFLLVSSAAVYGDPDTIAMPLREETPLAPASPYAASKAAAEHAVLEWGRRNQARAMVARPANHTGPGQSEHYFLPSMAYQITRVARGEAVTIKTGNLEAGRDFSHVEDVIAAYRALLERGRANAIYNVASGQARPVSHLLQGLIQASGRRVECQTSAERVRQESPRSLEISIARLQADTGWAPQRGLDQLYAELIEFWERQG